MNNSQTKTLWDIIRIVLSLPFLAVGVFAWVWSTVCFVGGPDGRIGSPESIRFGFSYMLFSVICGGVFLLLNRKKRWALVTLIILYAGGTAFLAFGFTFTFLQCISSMMIGIFLCFSRRYSFGASALPEGMGSASC